MTSTMKPHEGVFSPELHLAADAPQSWSGFTPMTTSAVGPYGEPGPQQLCLGVATSTTTPMTMLSTVGPYGEPGPEQWSQIAAAQRSSRQNLIMYLRYHLLMHVLFYRTILCLIG